MGGSIGRRNGRAVQGAVPLLVVGALALVCTMSCQSSGPTPKVPIQGLHLSEIHDAEDWFLAMRTYPHGIPTGARARALEAAAAMGKTKTSKTRQPMLLAVTHSWFPLGPTPLDETPQSSGRATVIWPNPANAQEVWLGTATGGVWHTSNAQTTDPVWQILNDLQFPDSLNGGTVTPGAMAMSIGSLKGDGCDQGGCQRLWIGTGEDGIRRETYWGSGLYLATPNAPVTQVKDFRYGSVVAIAFAPHASGTTNTLLVAVSSGATAAGNEETTTGPASPDGYGFFETTDSVNFNPVSVLPATVAGKWLPTDVQFDPNDPNLILVGVASLNEASSTGGGRYDPSAPRGIFRSTDGGQTWCSVNDNTAADPGIQECVGSNGLPPGSCVGSSGLPPSSCVYPGLPQDFQPDEVLGQITLRFSPNVQGRVYALVGQCGHRARFACPGSALYRSEDKGLTWTQVDLGGNVPSYGRYTHALAAAPGGSMTSEPLVVGGVSVGICDGVLGGCTPAPNLMAHSDHHDLVFPDPTNSGLLYDADDGGFFWATNVLQSSAQWTPGNSTLTTNQFDGIAVVNGTVLGGIQDNGMGFFAGSSDWRQVPFGDGGQVVAYSYGSPPVPVWLYETYQSLPSRSVGDPTAAQTDLTPSFQSSAPSAVQECSTINNAPPQTCGFFNPLAVKQDTHDFYVGTVSVYKSNDTSDPHGNSWVPIGTNLAEQVSLEPDIETDNVITALSVSNDGTVYAGSYIGEVLVSPPACNDLSCNASWKRVVDPLSASDPLPQLPVSSVLVDPKDSRFAFVTLSGFGSASHVWRTTDRGVTWQDFSAGLVDAPVNVIRFDPGGNLWLGTDVGIYGFPCPLLVCEWKRDESGSFPYVPVVDIASEQAASGAQRLYAATHGRGVWVQTEPYVQTFQAGTSGSTIVPVYGSGFTGGAGCVNGCACTMTLMQQSGHVCAQGPKDEMGGSILTDSSGHLYTSLGNYWYEKPVVWACLGLFGQQSGQCIGGTPVAQCNQDSMGDPDPLSEVLVDCGTAGHGIGHIVGTPTLSSPPSGSLTAFDPPPKPSSPPPPPPPPSWTFDAAVSLATATGAQVLCQAPVTVPNTATRDQMVTAAAAALNASPLCTAAGVTAITEISPFPPDDDRSYPSTLTVRGQSLTGSELYVTFRGAPGKITNLCFDPAGLGDPTMRQASIVTTQILTSAAGAAGGSIRFMEDSDIGSCSQDVQTTPGMTATQIVAAIAQAFNSVRAPGLAECLARSDPMDIQVHGAAFDTALPHRLRLCSFDPGVGFSIGPNSVTVPNLPPDCSKVTAAPAELWPPDHKFVPITLSGATDPDGDTVTLSVDRVRQDENPQGQIDAELVAGQLLLRSERDGNGDGRVYHIDFTADDGQGGTCSGEVTVCVPHDQGMLSCIDEGPVYPSGVP